MTVQPQNVAEDHLVIHEVIRHALQAIPAEIEANLTRTAFSPLVYDYKDFAVGVVDRTGKLICQGDGGIPTFLTNILGLAVRDGLLLYQEEGLHDGDVIISNHAGTFGQHLNNVVMFTPVMDDANVVIIAFMCVVVHWIDVGGKSIGSSASNNTTEIYQEGIQLRTVKLRNRGYPVKEIYRIIECNTRFPKELLGDVASQVAGCLRGKELFYDIVRRYGKKTVEGAVQTMWSQSENVARLAVLAIPDGIYHADSVFDNDGIDFDSPIHIPISVSVTGDRLAIDFSRLNAAVRGPFNSGKSGGGITVARIAFKYLTTPNEPTNEGSFAPLEIILPEGTFISAPASAPLAKYSTPFPTIIDTIIRALASAMPERTSAGHHANMGTHRFSGRNPDTDALFSQSDTMNGGWGAVQGRDGSGPFKTMSHGDTLDIPVEAQEARNSYLITSKTLRIDSGGAGEYRGGLGTSKEYLILVPTTLTLTIDRTHCLPWGLMGGLDGTGSSAEIVRIDGSIELHFKVSDLKLWPGDIVRLHSGGGGGLGDPHLRSAERLTADIRAGYVSKEAARDVYR